MNSESRLARVESAIKSAFPVDEQWMRTHWPKNTWSVLAAVPTLERRRMLALMIDRGEVPISATWAASNGMTLSPSATPQVGQLGSLRRHSRNRFPVHRAALRQYNGQSVSTGNWMGDLF